MTRTSNARSIGAALRLAGAALAAAAAFLPSPAAAEQARAILSVTATVLPTCQVSAGGGETDAQVQCSSGTSWTSATATRTGTRPLDQAASILGAPMRDSGRVVLSGDAGAAQRTGTTSYLTITY